MRKIAMRMAAAGAMAVLLGAGAATQSAGGGGDYSDPKKAAESFLTALEKGDDAGARAALVISPESKNAVDLYLRMINSTLKLQKAAMDRFGHAAEEYFGSAEENVLSARLKLVEDSPMKITGDSAVITIPEDATAHQKGGTVVLIKSGTAWKLDAGTLFGLNTMSKDDVAKQSALATKLIPISDQAAADIAAGKYPAAADAFQDFWSKSLEAMKTVNGAATQK